jgi:hypothetical protein
MRDNPAGAAVSISSLWPDSKSAMAEEPGASVEVRFPSIPKVKGVIRLINLLADDALTPHDLATRSMTEEVLSPKMVPTWRFPALDI